jgi:hypothetical protein
MRKQKTKSKTKTATAIINKLFLNLYRMSNDPEFNEREEEYRCFDIGF